MLNTSENIFNIPFGGVDIYVPRTCEGHYNSLPLYHITGKQSGWGRNKGWGEWTGQRLYFFI
jgi:hypothetical protein